MNKSTTFDVQAFSAALKELYSIDEVRDMLGGTSPWFASLEKKAKLRKANIFKHIKEKYINEK